MNNLKDLTKPIPFRWKVQAVFGTKAQCVPYLRAQDIMDLLDDVVGVDGWKDEYKEIKGNMFCGISLNINGEWVTKWDCGIESQFDKEKGEASDAFKRAAVKFGIGRFLKEVPKKWVDVLIEGEGKNKKTTPVYYEKNNPVKIKDLTEYFRKLDPVNPVETQEEKLSKFVGTISNLQGLNTFYKEKKDLIEGSELLKSAISKRKAELYVAGLNSAGEFIQSCTNADEVLTAKDKFKAIWNNPEYTEVLQSLMDDKLVQLAKEAVQLKAEAKAERSSVEEVIVETVAKKEILEELENCSTLEQLDETFMKYPELHSNVVFCEVYELTQTEIQKTLEAKPVEPLTVELVHNKIKNVSEMKELNQIWKELETTYSDAFKKVMFTSLFSLKKQEILNLTETAIPR